jgi:uncharacterized membrane protein
MSPVLSLRIMLSVHTYERGVAMTDEQQHDRRPKDPAGGTTGSLSNHIDQNIESMAALQRREREMIGAPQRLVERMSRFIGRPAYLLGLLIFVLAWIGANVGRPFGLASFDPAPFELLDGVLTFAALVTTTIVLIAQNRQTRREQQHRHLDLQLGLLTEQKVTKLIHLVEELRRDMPMVKDRHDSKAAEFQEAADTAAVVSAIDKGGLASDDDPSKAKGKP